MPLIFFNQEKVLDTRDEMSKYHLFDKECWEREEEREAGEKGGGGAREVSR